MSTIQDQFKGLWIKILCKDLKAWNYVCSLADHDQDPLAQAIVAISHSYGLACPKDPGIANQYGLKCLDWLKTQSDHNSRFCLGWFYRHGVGVEVNFAEAESYWNLAAQENSELAQSELGVYYFMVAKQPVEAVKWFRLAVESGYGVAQVNLGHCLVGGHGTEKNCEEGFSMYRLAAEQGFSDAMNMVGVCYELAMGVEKNTEEALKWYRLAMDLGDPQALANLAACYREGKGVKKDFVEAVRLYQIGIDRGFSSAQNGLGVCCQDGNGVERDLISAVEWYRLSAAQGNHFAECNLGWCYQHALGVARDIQEAIRLYTLASSDGNELAVKRLSSLQQPAV